MKFKLGHYQELERLAKMYAKIRDKRQALTTQEVDIKGQLLAAMKRNKKEVYEHGKISIKILLEEETVKVKIRKDDDDPEE